MSVRVFDFQRQLLVNPEVVVERVLQILEDGQPDSNVVFDIDQTLLVMDREVQKCSFAKHVDAGKKLYDKATAKNFAVHLVTARPYTESNHEWTKKQLKCLGYDNYKSLHMVGRNDPAQDKRKARQLIIQNTKDRPILLNVGDQWSDHVEHYPLDAAGGKDRFFLFCGDPGEGVMWYLKMPEK